MRSRTRLVLALVLLLRPLAAAAPEAQRYAATFERTLRHSLTQIAHLASVAEPAADRLVAGGHLLAGGSMPGFDIEALGRAGGLGMVERVTPKTVWHRGDVMLYGLLGDGTGDDAKALDDLRSRGVMVILFGADGPVARHADAVIATGLKGDGLVTRLRDGKEIAPLDGVVNVANLWAFSGELIAALTRRGKMPVILQSVFLPGSRERNASLRAKPFDDRFTITAIPRCVLGTQYLQRQIAHLRYLQQPARQQALDRAAALAVEAAQAGHTLWVWQFGHYPPYVPGTPGDPGLWQTLKEPVKPETVTARLKPGDVLLHIGYTEIEQAILTAAKAAGAKTIAVVAGRTDGPPPNHELPDVWIDPNWILGDADVSIPGYDVPALPPSGDIGIGVYWMIVAETASRLDAAKPKG